MTSEISKRPAVTRPPRLEPEVGNVMPRIPSRTGPRSSPHDGRSGQSRRGGVTGEFEASARAFAEGAFRMLLEVMDRRRPFAQLRPHLDPELRESAQALLAARRGGTKTATLRRVRVQAVGPHVAEAFGTFARGPRVQAVAARLTLGADRRWSVSALALP